MIWVDWSSEHKDKKSYSWKKFRITGQIRLVNFKKNFKIFEMSKLNFQLVKFQFFIRLNITIFLLIQFSYLTLIAFIMNPFS